MTATVLVVRSQPDPDAAALEQHGLRVVSEPYLVITPCDDDDAGARVTRLLGALGESGSWLVCASANGIRSMAAIAGAGAVREALATASAAAVGPATAEAIREAGGRDPLVPEVHTAEALVAAMAHREPAIAVLPRSDIGGAVLSTGLTAQGWTIVTEVTYRTRATTTTPASAAGLAAGAFDAVVLRSPSAVDAVLGHAGPIPERTAVIVGGPTTAATARARGIAAVTIAADSSPRAVAEATAAAVREHRG